MKNFIRLLLVIGVSAIAIVACANQVGTGNFEPGSSTSTETVVTSVVTSVVADMPIVSEDMVSTPKSESVVGPEVAPKIDYPDPLYVSIPTKGVVPGVEAVTFGVYNSCNRQRDPCKGIVDWWYDDQFVGPCENGPVDITGHGNKPYGEKEPFFNLVDDEEFLDDSGLVIDDLIMIVLEDGTVCTYVVIEPIECSLANVFEGQPAIWFLKNESSFEDGSGCMDQFADIIGDRPILILNTSYAGPNANGFEVKNG